MQFTKMVCGTALVLSLQIFICLSVFAETVPRQRSIKEIVTLALEYSAELAALKKEVFAKQALVIQAGTLSNPTLEFQSSTGGLTGSPDEKAVTIGINQELPLYGKTGLKREAAQRETDSFQRQLENAERLLKDDVSTLVLSFSLATKRLALAAKLVALNRDLVSIAGDRFKAGDIPELDVNIAKVELTRAESRLLEVEGERIPLRSKIASLTGLNENDIELSDTLFAPIPPPVNQDLVKLALASRPDLMGLSRDRDKAETENRLSKIEAFPTVTAGIFAQWERGSVEVGGMSSTSRDTQMGFSLSMPIPVFDRNRGGRSAAQARLVAADSRRLALERTIKAEVEAATSSLSSSNRIISLLEQGIIPQLTENLKLIQEAYRLGEVGILAMIDEQKKFFEVNEGYLSALHSSRVALIKLETAVATDLTGGVK